VCTVWKSKAKKRALKVLRQSQALPEFDSLRKAYQDKAPVVQALDEKHNDSFAAAYIMRPVGTCTSTPCSNHDRETVSLLFSSLFQLHSTGWYHGDARWQNAILCKEGRVLWCDFMYAKKLDPMCPYYLACDLQQLAKSLLIRQGLTIPTVSEMEQQVSENLESYNEIAKIVSDALVSGRPPTN
jgi:tRNA A-37 threonylcarbamoyl transferase component Bud32